MVCCASTVDVETSEVQTAAPRAFSISTHEQRFHGRGFIMNIYVQWINSQHPHVLIGTGEGDALMDGERPNATLAPKN
jgi:hypothetical protein